MSRRLLLLLALPLGVHLAGCLSPTLPLPPPDEPESIELSTSDPALWNLRGFNEAGSHVIITNLASGDSFGTTDEDGDGEYFIQVRAQVCDPAEIFEIVDTTVTPATGFIIAPTDLDSGVDCP